MRNRGCAVAFAKQSATRRHLSRVAADSRCAYLVGSYN